MAPWRRACGVLAAGPRPLPALRRRAGGRCAAAPAAASRGAAAAAGREPEAPAAPPSLAISPLEIARLPELRFGGRVVIVSSLEEEARVESLFDGEVLLGFDSESRPHTALAPRNRTAVAQLASEHVACLWRLGVLRCVPPLLRRLLEDPKVLKVAQGATHELAALREEWGVGGQSFIDLHHIALNLRTTPRSLQGLAAIFLQRKLVKEQRLSDWEQTPLTQAQIEYAATDAWAGRQVLVAMRRAYRAERLDCERLLGSAAGTPRPPPEGGEEAASPAPLPQRPPAAAAQAAEASGAAGAAAPGSGVEAHQALAALCIARGHTLRFEGFESAPGGFRCVFRVDVRRAGRHAVSELYRSARVHSTIRAAQNDAAAEALEHLASMAGEGSA